jgi:hypothetical protein
MEEMGFGIQMKAANTMNKLQQPDCKINLLVEQMKTNSFFMKAHRLWVLDLHEYYILQEDFSREYGVKASLWDNNFCTRTCVSLVLRLLEPHCNLSFNIQMYGKNIYTLHRAEKLTKTMP